VILNNNRYPSPYHRARITGPSHGRSPVPLFFSRTHPLFIVFFSVLISRSWGGLGGDAGFARPQLVVAPHEPTSPPPPRLRSLRGGFRRLRRLPLPLHLSGGLVTVLRGVSCSASLLLPSSADAAPQHGRHPQLPRHCRPLSHLCWCSSRPQPNPSAPISPPDVASGVDLSLHHGKQLTRPLP
jgi:hypothetical protein